MNTAKAFGWVTGVAGLWEILAPFILGYGAVSGALWDAVILGVVLLGLGIWTALSANMGTVRSLSWIDAVLGIWLVLAPFIVAYSGTVGALINDIIVGAVIVVFEIWGALAVGADAGKLATR